ncbi:hypothetical protein HX829_12355 [Pseudomonas gingeri]|uniref:Uncharacterized protein n=1 Tax=Pseudomonas gingeri TaxID=117681 RepID=A0A7Y7WDP7_9PSED|nr:hypothetical protein [Pseudomonas gingeri]
MIPPKRPSKTIARDAIKIARDWLKAMVSEERCSNKRSKVTPAWFWLAAFEMFYYTGIRLNALAATADCVRHRELELLLLPFAVRVLGTVGVRIHGYPVKK